MVPSDPQTGHVAEIDDHSHNHAPLMHPSGSHSTERQSRHRAGRQLLRRSGPMQTTTLSEGRLVPARPQEASWSWMYRGQLAHGI
jgi:hypothetical protein